MNKTQVEDMLETVQKYRKEIEAFVEGKKIQWRFNGGTLTTKWTDTDNPNFILDEEYEYRVKPEPVIKYAIVDCANNIYETCDTKGHALLRCEQRNESMSVLNIYHVVKITFDD